MGEQNRRLGRHVTVGGETYGPLDDLPDDVAAQITNPAAWERTEASAAAEEAAGQATRRGGTSSGHRLVTTVTVGGETYGPLDDLPDDVAARITNPAVWEGGALPGTGKQKAEEAPSAEPADTDDEPAADTEEAPSAEPADTATEDADTGTEPKARRKRS